MINAIINGMEILHIPIDKAGRVVLPKIIRDHLGLHAGSELKVSEENNQIILKPVQNEPKLVSKKGVLVVVPEKILEPDVVKVIQKVRDERIRRFW